jgi:hypothetical protein
LLVELGPYRLDVAEGFGPRVTGLRRGDGPQMFASLGPDAVLRHPGGIYSFRGGHRVWAAPEVARITYAADDDPCVVTAGEDSVEVTGKADAAGVIKTIAVSLAGDTLEVTSRIALTSALEDQVAPWAITQLPPGGVAVLPVTGPATTPLPNRQIILWPYTDLTDDRIEIGKDSILVRASSGGNLKLGLGAATRRFGYWREGSLFVKGSMPGDGGSVPDFGAAAQLFVGEGFCELETVGSLISGAPGESGAVVEKWTVVECEDLDSAIELVVGGV